MSAETASLALVTWLITGTITGNHQSQDAWRYADGAACDRERARVMATLPPAPPGMEIVRPYCTSRRPDWWIERGAKR